MNPENKQDRDNLLSAIDVSWRGLSRFRQKRKQFIKEYVGSHWSEEGSATDSIVNLMEQTAEVYTQSLAANRPQLLLSTEHADLDPFAYRFQVAINNLLNEIRIQDVIAGCTLDAFFSMGIAKVYTADAGAVQLDGTDELLDPGKPFAERVSLDDWTHDIRATQWSKIAFARHRYRVPYAKVMAEPSYTEAGKAELKPDTKYYNQSGEEPVRSMQWGCDPEDPEPMVELCDIWLPFERLILIMPYSGNGPPLKIVPWEGPERGPFKILSFADVPDNVMGLSPAQNLTDLNVMINGILRKLRRQSQRQKDITIYTDGADQDAKRINRTRDGDMVRVDDPTAIGQLKFGGVDQGNMAFAMGMIDVYDRMAGNLKAMAGLGAQSGTATQDQLLANEISRRQARMYDRVLDFSTEIARDLGWLLWIDSWKTIPARMELPNEQFTVDVTWTPENREGNFLDYNFKIDLYSQQYKSPTQRMEQLDRALMTISNLMPMTTLAGGPIDLAALVDIYAELGGIPRLRRIIQTQPNESRPGPWLEGAMAKPNNTRREYVRKNVGSGANNQGTEMLQAMMENQPQPQQGAMMNG